MLIEILQQIIGLMVILSCCSTIFYYIRFKKHQKVTSGRPSPSFVVSGFSVIAVIFIMMTYTQSFLHRLQFVEKGALQSGLIFFEKNNDIIIDTRPFKLCVGSDSFGDVKSCLSNPFNSLYTEEPNYKILRDSSLEVDWS